MPENDVALASSSSAFGDALIEQTVRSSSDAREIEHRCAQGPARRCRIGYIGFTVNGDDVISGGVMRAVPIGAQGSFSMVVSPEHLANRFKDMTLPAVLSTPVMIMAMENAALNAIKPYFDAGESAVGTHVDVHHVAATAVDRRIVAYAEVTAVKERHVEFRVHAVDGGEQIGHGTHRRIVIDVAKFTAQLAGKLIDKPA